MIKLVPVTAIVLGALSITVSIVHGQILKRPDRTPHPDTYQEYVYNVNQFYNSRRTYEADRSKYIAYKTVSSREEALRSTVSMLENARTSLLAYVNMIEQALLQQEDFNPRVKNALLTDLNTHKTYLLDSARTVDEISTLEQAVVVSNAFQQRYTYVRASATQSLTYIDAMTAKKRNDAVRTLVLDFKALVAGYPSDNNNRVVVEKWTEEMLPQLAENENLLVELVDTMYPAENKQKPFYEDVPEIKTRNLTTVTSRHLQYAQRLKEIDQIAREAYKEL